MVQSRTKRRYKSKKRKYTRKYTRKKQIGGDIKGKLRSATNTLKKAVGDAKGSFDNYKDLMRLTTYLGTQKGPFGSLKFSEYYPKLWTRINNNSKKDDKLKHITSRLSNDNEVMLYLYYITKFIKDFKLEDKIIETGQSLQYNESTSEPATEPATEPVAEPATELVAEPATEPATEDMNDRVDKIEEKLNKITASLQNTASSK